MTVHATRVASVSNALEFEAPRVHELTGAV